MTSHRNNISPSPDDGQATAATWSPRNRLFFLVGATVAGWGVVALVIEAWM